MSHHDGHPVEHATGERDRDAIDAARAMLRELDALLALHGRSPEQQARAVALVERLEHDAANGDSCNCRLEGWYRAMRARLGNPVAWAPWR